MPIPPELAASCADVRLAEAADSIAGRPARFVAAPDSTAEASALLRTAAALRLTVVPRGAGRLQHWGNPPDRCDLIVDTHRLNRIVERRPDDLTVTVQAGVRLRDLERALAPARQTTALFPPRPAAAGTIGGLIATNAAGSHRYGLGTPRDRLTAVTAVRPDGIVIGSGGSAGGDGAVRIDGTAAGDGRRLVALLAGSFGSLGLITEATFLLDPCPQLSGGLGLDCDDPEHAQRLMEAVADPSIGPLGIDLRWPSADGRLRLLVLLRGERADYEARAARVCALAGREALPPIDGARARRLDDPDHGGLPPEMARRLLARQAEIRAEIENPSPDTGTLVRVSFPPSRLAAALRLIRAAAAGTGIDVAIEGSAIVGVLDVKVAAEAPPATAAAFVAALRAELGRLADGPQANPPRAVVVYAPGDVRALTDAHGPIPSLARLRAVKDEFDPDHRMAPGRLADAV